MASNIRKLHGVAPSKVLSLLERASHLEQRMAHVCTPQRVTYSGVMSVTSSDTHTVVATAYTTNLSNTSYGTRPKDTLTDAYAMPLKITFPSLPEHRAHNTDAGDGFTLHPIQRKRQLI